MIISAFSFLLSAFLFAGCETSSAYQRHWGNSNPPPCMEKPSPYGKKYSPWVYCYEHRRWQLIWGLEP